MIANFNGIFYLILKYPKIRYFCLRADKNNNKLPIVWQIETKLNRAESVNEFFMSKIR